MNTCTEKECQTNATRLVKQNKFVKDWYRTVVERKCANILLVRNWQKNDTKFRSHEWSYTENAFHKDGVVFLMNSQTSACHKDKNNGKKITGGRHGTATNTEE